MHWDYTLILGILAVIVPWRTSSRIRNLLDGPPLTSSTRIFLYLSTIIFQWVTVALILWRCLAHHLPWTLLGVVQPHPLRSAAVASGVSAVLVFNQVYAIRRVAVLPYDKRGLVAKLTEKLLPRTPKEAFVGILLVLTVAICEEFIYRGFVEGVFTNIFAGSALAGALISAAFFSFAHIYQGRKGLLTTFAVGLILSAARIWTGSLLPSIVIHFAVDFSVAVAALKFMPPLQDPLALVALYLAGLGSRFRRAGRRTSDRGAN